MGNRGERDAMEGLRRGITHVAGDVEDYSTCWYHMEHDKLEISNPVYPNSNSPHAMPYFIMDSFDTHSIQSFNDDC